MKTQISILALVYWFQEDIAGQSVWDKVRCFWEHIRERIRNLVNLLRTHWELDVNTVGT